MQKYIQANIHTNTQVYKHLLFRYFYVYEYAYLSLILFILSSTTSFHLLRMFILRNLMLTYLKMTDLCELDVVLSLNIVHHYLRCVRYITFLRSFLSFLLLFPLHSFFLSFLSFQFSFATSLPFLSHFFIFYLFSLLLSPMLFIFSSCLSLHIRFHFIFSPFYPSYLPFLLFPLSSLFLDPIF